jgi:polyhydroxybutyrate depolymerase
MTEFSKKADEKGFIVVYPNAKLMPYNPQSGEKYVYDFNYGWIPSLGWKYIDDIGFIRALIDKMKKEYTINSSRIYVTGFSAGGEMSHSIGAYLSDEVAAIAPVSGTIGGRANENNSFSYIPSPNNPVSVIVLHGTADSSIPYEGNSLYISVNESISFWVEHNGCNPTPEIHWSASGKTIQRTYTNGENGTEVVLYSLVGFPHGWPFISLISEIKATDLIWDFFAAHPKQ